MGKAKMRRYASLLPAFAELARYRPLLAWTRERWGGDPRKYYKVRARIKRHLLEVEELLAVCYYTGVPESTLRGEALAGGFVIRDYPGNLCRVMYPGRQLDTWSREFRPAIARALASSLCLHLYGVRRWTELTPEQHKDLLGRFSPQCGIDFLGAHFVKQPKKPRKRRRKKAKTHGSTSTNDHGTTPPRTIPGANQEVDGHSEVYRPGGSAHGGGSDQDPVQGERGSVP